MRQTIQQPQPPLDVTALKAGCKVEIDMRGRDGGRRFADDWPQTIFVVKRKGNRPLIELRRTADGRVCGPLMYFVGSAATRAELQVDDDRVNRGLIVPGEYLLVASRGWRRQPMTLPGLVIGYTCVPPLEVSVGEP